MGALGVGVSPEDIRYSLHGEAMNTATHACCLGRRVSCNLIRSWLKPSLSEGLALPIFKHRLRCFPHLPVRHAAFCAGADFSVFDTCKVLSGYQPTAAIGVKARHVQRARSLFLVPHSHTVHKAGPDVLNEKKGLRKPVRLCASRKGSNTSKLARASPNRLTGPA
eukprot:1156567-Pelagomonas_calceolata.AAC.1